MTLLLHVMVSCILFSTNFVVAEEFINFLTIGDWGGRDVFPYHTKAQVETAAGMGLIASEINSSFVVALGDNFYTTGVKSTNSQRFQSTFQNVYEDESLMKPWYVIGGNHDHYGNITAQIEYTKKQPKKYGHRWVFPAHYHSHSFESSPSIKNEDETSFTIDLILIDTVDLCGLNIDAIIEEQEGYFDPLPLLPKDNAMKQWGWIERKLNASTADYVLVGGHYPVYSVCSHGPTETLIQNLRPLLQKYNAHYLSGHDHCMMHALENGVNYILSGMGDMCCYNADNLDNRLIPEGVLKWFISKEKQALYQADGGFTSFQATKKQMIVKYHDQRGDVLYEADPILSRETLSKIDSIV
mmetsp:Transcript_14348/g.22102  ORF Transcript_14348/g.22102 Transcript_14348/m.22102 type:complete len:355 (+) Transcript_14348:130-1194(+)|eukprot:CAMPEP_0194248752 /NCGR_PEP_ID=MMETSP0158-20130606/19040_1 /TAXON_ID=33649 /ORGANISM="Thalassionema nitzschioides, Strain L26-B" /LENGTH=354 /DNA_ID=CAMNT_0038985129 /DNA_START=28 /DNA_END=1092 /DNA_ORIENTATION=+